MTRLSGKSLWAVFLSLVMVLSVSGAIAIMGSPISASHSQGDSQMINPSQDYTDDTWDSVWWGYGPNAHETGEETGWAFRSTANDARGDGFDMEYFQYVAIHAPWADMSNCAVTDTDVAGVDRDDDNWDGNPYDPSNDESLVGDIQDSKITEHYGYFQFAGPNDPGGRGINIDAEDSFTAGLSCFQNPEEEGWYRLSVWFNGTDYEGNQIEFLGWNEWKYICDDAANRCADREQAIETLGPPPTEFNYPTGERSQNYEPDTQWAHTSGAPSGGGDDGGDGGATATPPPSDDDGGDGEPTATQPPSDDDGDDGTGDDGTGDDGAGDDGTGDDGAGDDGTGDDGAGDDGTGDDGAGDDGTGDDGADDDGTPAADGPGFGAVIAVIALLASGLLMARRRRE